MTLERYQRTMLSILWSCCRLLDVCSNCSALLATGVLCLIVGTVSGGALPRRWNYHLRRRLSQLPDDLAQVLVGTVPPPGNASRNTGDLLRVDLAVPYDAKLLPHSIIKTEPSLRTELRSICILLEDSSLSEQALQLCDVLAGQLPRHAACETCWHRQRLSRAYPNLLGLVYWKVLTSW